MNSSLKYSSAFSFSSIIAFASSPWVSSFVRKNKESSLNKENTVQETISYYLNNNIVPGFCAENFDNFKKENIYQSKELTNPETYETDKTFNILKDDLSIYNEKFFLEKEIDKKRKKNEAEKLGKDPKK